MSVEKLRKNVTHAINYLRTEPFSPAPLLTLDQLFEREKQMALGSNLVDRIINGVRHTNTLPSADNHYGECFAFKWDSCTHIFMNAKNGRPDLAASEYRTIERYRDKQTGFMPVKFAIEGVPYTPSWPESKTTIKEGIGSYSQPSINGWAIWETYQSYLRAGRHVEGKKFLEEAYGTAKAGNYTGLRGECAYFLNHRQTGPDNPLLFNIDPNETGRDFDLALDGPNKPLLTGEGIIICRMNDLASVARLHKQRLQMAELGKDHEAERNNVPKEQRRSDWIPEQVRENYSVNDVMFNVMHVMNLRYTAQIARELGKHEDAAEYTQQAKTVEDAILTRMWDPETKFFYNLDKNSNKILVPSITGLCALMLEGIREPQHRDKFINLINKLDPEHEEGPKWFATPYPIPSHPVCSPYFDPHYRRREGPNWQGGVWGIPNYFIGEGLARHADAFLSSTEEKLLGLRCMKIGGWVVTQSHELLAINPETREHYNPITGQGQRVRGFMWSNLMLHFDEYETVRQKYNLPEYKHKQQILLAS